MVNSSGIPYQEYSYVGPEVAATAKETSKEVKCFSNLDSINFASKFIKMPIMRKFCVPTQTNVIGFVVYGKC